MSSTKEQSKEYQKAYYQEHKEQINAASKAYYQAHKQERQEYQKAHKEQRRASMKSWKTAHRESEKTKKKAWRAANKDKIKAYTRDYSKLYIKSDVNSLGKTKHSIRLKSQKILKKMNLHIPCYQIHHCFGYEDPSKFIYISKSLHLKIHQFLRDNKISADTDHWMQIRDIVNNTDEFMYIKC